MKRIREERFKKSVAELEQRLGRAENFIDTELVENKSMERSASRSELNTEVYRDKNTLVEVTIHRRPKEKESKKDLTQFARPTSSSLSRVNKSPGKVKKSAKRISGARHSNKDARVSDKDDRSVRDILGELRDIVKVSGIKEVDAFIDEYDGNFKTGILKQVKSPQKKCLKPDQSEHEKKIKKLESECQKFKTEVSRYKQEYVVMMKNVEISKETVNSLEVQVVDLKKIVSRLTRNNGELLGIVSEKINYEDLIADLEKNKLSLSKELNEEKSLSSQLEDRLQSAESEAAGLRSLSAELRAGLRHGLAGLELPRPASKQALPTLGDDTRNILGIKDGEDVHSDTDDSAYDDPNTESLRSRPKSAQYKDKAMESSRPLAQVLKQKIPPQPITASQVFRATTQVAPNISSSPPTKMTMMTSPPHQFLPPQQLPHPAATMLDLLAPPAQSRSSTMVESPTVAISPAFQPLPIDLSETASEASQTVGVEKLIFSQFPNSSSTPPTVIENLAQQEKPTKQSLETKVSSFLSRLHQDSLQLQLSHPLPQAEPFPGASMHLSLSSSDIDQDISRQSINTTLTEGRFLRGLETSIEVLQAELSKNSD